MKNSRGLCGNVCTEMLTECNKQRQRKFFSQVEIYGCRGMWILTRSDTNQAVQPLKMARNMKFWI